MIARFEIFSVEVFLLFIVPLTALIVLNKFLKNFPHEVIVLFNKPLFLLELFVVFIHVILDLLLIDILEDAFHVLVVFWGWVL